MKSAPGLYARVHENPDGSERLEGIAMLMELLFADDEQERWAVRFASVKDGLEKDEYSRVFYRPVEAFKTIEEATL